MKRVLMTASAALLAMGAVFFLVICLPVLLLLKQWTSNAVELTWTRTVLVEKENPTATADLGWYLRPKGPIAGGNVTAFPPYSTYAVVTGSGIERVDGKWQAEARRLSEMNETAALSEEWEAGGEEEIDRARYGRIYDVLRQNQALADSTRDPFTLYPAAVTSHGKRTWVLCMEDNRYYDPDAGIESYAGCYLYYVILNEEENAVLFAAWYVLDTYWGGTDHQAYLLGETGMPICLP